MNFGQALEKVKSGEKIFRHGWNGKNMFVVYQKGYPDGIPCNMQTAKAWGLNEGDLFKCEPYLQIKMVNGSHAMWVPSITIFKQKTGTTFISPARGIGLVILVGD